MQLSIEKKNITCKYKSWSLGPPWSDLARQVFFIYNVWPGLKGSSSINSSTGLKRSTSSFVNSVNSIHEKDIFVMQMELKKFCAVSLCDPYWWVSDLQYWTSEEVCMYDLQVLSMQVTTPKLHVNGEDITYSSSNIYNVHVYGSGNNLLFACW